MMMVVVMGRCRVLPTQPHIENTLREGLRISLGPHTRGLILDLALFKAHPMAHGDSRRPAKDNVNVAWVIG